MHTPYVRKAREPKRNRLELMPGFRLIRGFSREANATRLLRHVRRLQLEEQRTAAGRRFRMKLRQARRGRA